jgi:hypothetical protein
MAECVAGDAEDAQHKNDMQRERETRLQFCPSCLLEMSKRPHSAAADFTARSSCVSASGRETINQEALLGELRLAETGKLCVGIK